MTEDSHPYDDLSDEEQAAVRADWDKQISSKLKDLNLEAGFILAGQDWVEADEEGRAVIQSGEAHLITARAAASWVRTSLAAGKVESANRVIPEAVSRIVLTHREITDEVVAEPNTTGDGRYDVLLATCFAFALMKRGVEPLPWMTALPALSEEWLFGGDGGESASWVDYIREHTPAVFLSKKILLRERDLIAP